MGYIRLKQFIDEDAVRKFKLYREDDFVAAWDVPENHPSRATRLIYNKEMKMYYWLRFGYYHNEVAPAIELPSIGRGIFYIDGNKHRLRGPAFFDFEKNEFEWVVRGKWLNSSIIYNWYIDNEVDLIPDLTENDEILFKIKYPNINIFS